MRVYGEKRASYLGKIHTDFGILLYYTEIPSVKI